MDNKRTQRFSEITGDDDKLTRHLAHALIAAVVRLLISSQREHPYRDVQNVIFSERADEIAL
jgi:hypothetical protein